MGYILLWLNVSLTFSTQIRFPSCLKLMSTWRRRTGLSLTYPWTAVFKGKKINKKREKIKRRCRILHNPPVALFAAASVLYSANESHQRASSSPTTHVLSSEETRAARCLFTFFFFSPTRYRRATTRARVPQNFCCPHVRLRPAHIVTSMTAGFCCWFLIGRGNLIKWVTVLCVSIVWECIVASPWALSVKVSLCCQGLLPIPAGLACHVCVRQTER